MLLRSASAPVLSSLVSEGDLDCSLFDSPFAASRPLCHNSGSATRMPLIRRATRSETDLQGFAHTLAEAGGRLHPGQMKRRHAFPKLSIISEREQTSSSIPEASRAYVGNEGFFTINRKPNSSGPLVEERERLNPLPMISRISLSSNTEDLIMPVDEGDHGCYGGGGSSAGGGGSSSNPHGDSDNMDLYYQKILHSDPHNPLFLRNYAQFLSEVRHDYKKSEVYYERSILACPNDGEVLSKYAKQLWDVHKDLERASSYFDRAVKATPEDCYVLASYASFLWQSEKDEEDTNKVMQTALPSLHGTCAVPSPLMASA